MGSADELSDRTSCSGWNTEMEFDPNYVWLSIPPNRRPITHYVLLGLQEFEGNPQVIDNAADQRMAHIRTFQTGQHANECHEILNHIARARTCLMNVNSKAEYDHELRSRSGVTESAAPQSLSDPAMPLEMPPEIPPAAMLIQPQGKRRKQPAIGIYVGAGSILIVAVAALLWLSGYLGTATKQESNTRVVDAGQADGFEKRSPELSKVDRAGSKKTLTRVKQEPRTQNTVMKDAVNSSESEAGSAGITAKETAEKSRPKQELHDADRPPDVTTLPVYCQTLQARRKPIKLSPLVSFVGGPPGKGRGGANGFLIDCEKGWETNSTVWCCNYYRSGSARGIQFIHPYQTGHVLVTVSRGMLRVNSPGAWVKEGYLGGASKINTVRTNAFGEMMKLEGGPPRELISVLGPDGRHRLYVDKVLVGETQLDHAVSLSMNKKGFHGERLPGVLTIGTAGILVGPRDRPANIASEVRFGVTE